ALSLSSPTRRPSDLLDGDLAVDAGKTVELLRDHPPLQLALVGGRHVLEVAPAAPAGAGDGAARRHPVRRGLEDVDGVRPQEAIADRKSTRLNSSHVK